MITKSYLFVFLILFVLIPNLLFAQTPEDETIEEDNTVVEEGEIPRTVAIQNRPYILNKEVGLYYSYMPLDHFNHFHSIGVNYLNYYNDYLAWEVFNAATASKQSTGLEDRLNNDYGAVPDDFDVIQYYFTSSVVYTPIYMKHLYKNKDIRFGDMSFVFGAGVARFEKAFNANMIEAGIITRFLGQEGINFKFDVRYKTFLSGNLRPNISLGLVFTYNFTNEVKNPQVLDEE